jgi:integrase
VPALSLYTGARLNELCQLSASDVGALEDVAYLDFSEFDADTGVRVEDRSVKTDASDRRVPIHADLIAAGFLDFVTEVRGGKGGRLFPECALGPDGQYSHGFSKWFGRVMDNVGLSARSLVFHSFRHGFQDACREAAIRQEFADALGGWASPRVAAEYGNRSRLRFLASESAKVGFDGFNLAEVARANPPVKGHSVPPPPKEQRST